MNASRGLGGAECVPRSAEQAVEWAHAFDLFFGLEVLGAMETELETYPASLACLGPESTSTAPTLAPYEPEPAAQLALNVFYIVTGLLALLGNAVILATLVLVSHSDCFRRSCNYLLLGNLVVVKCLRGGVLTAAGFRRLAASLSRLPPGAPPQTISHHACLLRNLPAVFSYPLENTVLLLVTVDALVYLVAHRSWQDEGFWKHGSWALIGLSWAGHLALTGLAFHNWEAKRGVSFPLSHCNTWKILDGWYFRLWNYLIVVALVGTVATLVGTHVLLAVFRERRRTQENLEDVARLLGTLTPIVSVFAALWLAYFLYTLLLVQWLWPAERRKEAAAYQGLFAPLNGAVNFLVLLWKAPEFRSSLVLVPANLWRLLSGGWAGIASAFRCDSTQTLPTSAEDLSALPPHQPAKPPVEHL